MLTIRRLIITNARRCLLDAVDDLKAPFGVPLRQLPRSFDANKTTLLRSICGCKGNCESSTLRKCSLANPIYPEHTKNSFKILEMAIFNQCLILTVYAYLWMITKLASPKKRCQSHVRVWQFRNWYGSKDGCVHGLLQWEMTEMLPIPLSITHSSRDVLI